MAERRRDRLGRGLESLLGEYFSEEEEPRGGVDAVPVRAVVPNPYQPRRDFDEGELEELARSIGENGLLQPIVVRPATPGGPAEGGDRFQLVAGERRWRAVKRLGWSEVPALVRDVDDRTLLVLALVENLQREELSPLDEAEGYKRLAEDFELTQAQIAEAVGRNRSTVSNTLRLLKLPPSVRRLLGEGRLDAGHARALLSVADPRRAAELGRKAAEEGWSVREVEARVRDEREPSEEGDGGGSSGSRATKEADPVMRALEDELRRVLGTKVRVRRSSGGKGKVEIPFYDDEDFERLFSLITGSEASEVLG